MLVLIVLIIAFAKIQSLISPILNDTLIVRTTNNSSLPNLIQEPYNILDLVFNNPNSLEDVNNVVSNKNQGSSVSNTLEDCNNQAYYQQELYFLLNKYPTSFELKNQLRVGDNSLIEALLKEFNHQSGDGWEQIHCFTRTAYLVEILKSIKEIIIEKVKINGLIQIKVSTLKQQKEKVQEQVSQLSSQLNQANNPQIIQESNSKEIQELLKNKSKRNNQIENSIEEMKQAQNLTLALISDSVKWFKKVNEAYYQMYTVKRQQSILVNNTISTYFDIDSFRQYIVSAYGYYISENYFHRKSYFFNQFFNLSSPAWIERFQNYYNSTQFSCISQKRPTRTGYGQISRITENQLTVMNPRGDQIILHIGKCSKVQSTQGFPILAQVVAWKGIPKKDRKQAKEFYVQTLTCWW